MNRHHPYTPGQVISEGIFRRVFVGTYGASALRFCYLSRTGDGRFHLSQYYGAGSFASAGDANQDLAFWTSRGICADLCAQIRKAMAEWPGGDTLVRLELAEGADINFWYGEGLSGVHIYQPACRAGAQLAYGQRSMVEATAREYERHGYKVRIV